MHHCNSHSPLKPYEKNSFPLIYIIMWQSVTQAAVTEDDILEAERLELNVETIMRLVDLIFLCQDEHEVIPS